MRCNPIIVMSLALALSATQSAAQSAFDQYFDISNLANPAQLGELVVRIEGASGVEDVSVTDLKLEIFQYEGVAKAALMAPNSGAEPVLFSAFMVNFDVVAGGKLYRDGVGICSPWVNDTSLCGIECDGGHFEISREISGDTYLLTLTMRTFPELFENHKRTAFNIGFCGESEAFYSLAPVADAPAEISFAVPLYYLD